MSEDGWHAICQGSDLKEGGMLPFEVGQFQIALYKVNGEIFATDNVCTHGMALLTDGFLDDDVVECPLHGGRFNIKTGQALCEPVDCDVKVYEIRQIDSRIEVLLDE